KKIKNIYLRLSKDGTINISAPKHATIAELREFVLAKQQWLIQQQKKLSRYSKQTTRLYQSGEIYYYLGKAYFLNVINQNNIEQIILSENNINIYLTSEANGQVLTPKYILNKWY